MAQALITPDVIAKEALIQLENNVVLGNRVHREYKREFVKKGDSVRIRKPVKFYTADGATRVNQDVEEGNTQITISEQKHVSWNFSSKDLTLTVEEYSERYIKPACITLAQTIDIDGYSQYYKLWNHVGTPGTTPGSFAQFAVAPRRLDEMAVPSDLRNIFLNPETHYSIAGDQTGLQQDRMVKDAYSAAAIGRLANMEAFNVQNVRNHTVGVATGTPTVSGAGQEVQYSAVRTNYQQTLNTAGWTNDTNGILKAGDVITIADVFSVNPVPGPGTTGKQTLPFLQEFTVLADADSGATTGPAALTIAPPIITSGPYQTVSAAPADGASITVKTGTGGSTYPQMLAMHRNCLALVTVPLEMPDGANWKARESHNGYSIRVIKDYDIQNDVDIIRLDVLYGWQAIYPELGVRLTG